METVTDIIFLGSKTTVDGDCSDGIQTRLLLGRKAMTNLDSILKTTDVTWPTKPRGRQSLVADKASSSQGYGFSSGHVWM